MRLREACWQGEHRATWNQGLWDALGRDMCLDDFLAWDTHRVVAGARDAELSRVLEARYALERECRVCRVWNGPTAKKCHNCDTRLSVS